MFLGGYKMDVSVGWLSFYELILARASCDLIIISNLTSHMFSYELLRILVFPLIREAVNHAADVSMRKIV